MYFMNNFGQEQVKDTLFFKYDKDYIIKSYNPNTFYLKDSSNDGTFILIQSDTLYNLNPKKVLCFKKFVHSSKFYRKNGKRKLDDYGLYSYLNKYILFFKKDKIFIRVYSAHSIE